MLSIAVLIFSSLLPPSALLYLFVPSSMNLPSSVSLSVDIIPCLAVATSSIITSKISSVLQWLDPYVNQLLLLIMILNRSLKPYLVTRSIYAALTSYEHLGVRLCSYI